MTSTWPLIAATCLLAAGCSKYDGPPLSIANIVVNEALPGTTTASGYLVLENHSDKSITIEHVSSPQFAKIEMHETVIENDMARMAPISPLVIAPKSSVEFSPGGKHLMLTTAAEEVPAGVAITIEFYYDSDGLLIVETTVRSRGDATSDH